MKLSERGGSSDAPPTDGGRQMSQEPAPGAPAPPSKRGRRGWAYYSPSWRLPGYRVLQREPRPRWLFDLLCWLETRLKRKLW